MITLRAYLHIVALVIVLGVLGSTPASAQEVQVPLDPDSTVYTLDAELRQELGLFPEVTGFQQAQLFRVAEERYELVIAYRQQGRALRERRSLSGAEVEQLRQRVARQLQVTQTRVGLEQPGRPEVLAWTTILGLAEGGLIVSAIDAEDSAAAGFPLLTGALGFFVPLFATQNHPVTEASGTLTGYGGLQGYAHTIQLVGLLGGEEVDGQAVAGLAAVGGAAEATAGYVLGAKRGWSPGMAEMIAYNGIAGNLAGLGIGATIVGDENDEDAELRLLSGTSLLGSLAGMYVGHRMGQTGTYTRGDARLYGLAGLEGAQLASSIIVLGDFDNGRVNAGLVTGLGLAGLGVGTALVKGRDFSTYESNIIMLGDIAGTLFGAGIATLGDGSGDTVTLLQALGSLAGFGITYGIFAGDAQRRARQSAARSTFDLDVIPSVGMISSGPMERSATFSDRIVPKVTIRCTF